MNILAIPATNSRTSINRQLLGYAAELLTGELAGDGAAPTVGFIDLNDYELAIFSPEREAAGIPELAQQLYARIGEADALIVSFAEYNGSYTPAWKNTFDWMSRINQKVYQSKPVAMFAASPGGRAGAGVLGSATTVAPHLGAELVGSLGVGTFSQNFDADASRIADAELDQSFRGVLQALLSATA